MLMPDIDVCAHGVWPALLQVHVLNVSGCRCCSEAQLQRMVFARPGGGAASPGGAGGASGRHLPGVARRHARHGGKRRNVAGSGTGQCFAAP